MIEIEGPNGKHLALDDFAEIMRSHPMAQAEEVAYKFFQRAQEHGAADDDQSVVIIKVKKHGESEGSDSG